MQILNTIQNILYNCFIKQTKNKEKSKHWVKAYDLHHKIDETFDHETSVAIASIDFAADEQERECFNEFSLHL